MGNRQTLFQNFARRILDKNEKINDKYNNLIKNINDEKSKFQPDTTKIEQRQMDLEENYKTIKLLNYKTQGTIISK